MGQQRVGTVAVEDEFRFRHEAVVHVALRERGIGGDEAGVASHHLYQPDAIVGAFGLVVRARRENSGHVDRGFKAEGLVDEGDVVVDGLGDADHADGEAAPLRFDRDIVRAARGAVAADAEYEVDVHAREGFDHDLGALLAARGAEDGAALLVDVVGVVLVELDRSESVRRVEAPVTVPDAVDQRHMVDVLERQRQELDHVVESGTESAGGQDRRFAPGRVMVDQFAGAGLFEGRDRLAVFHILLQHGGTGVVGDGGIVGDEFHGLNGRCDLSFPEPGNEKFFAVHSSSSPESPGYPRGRYRPPFMVK